MSPALSHPCPPARERPLGAAVQIVREKGFGTSSVDDLARAAGVTEGASFHHFASWMPQPPFMVGVFEFINNGAGDTLYRASARHWDEKTMRDHEAIGFADSWSAVADQLLAVARQVTGQ